ncbi:hypothetical protein Glove_99g68 [Diversispora epigaea]|uniref:Uncharacterized protein n=1 Tax=Diversispora epigaea TaxID=1348612 RepID=A0A397JEV9_9GLOM|nr:hypothetical protein Glove_99g68 [Diversispora epigaea]
MSHIARNLYISNKEIHVLQGSQEVGPSAGKIAKKYISSSTVQLGQQNTLDLIDCCRPFLERNLNLNYLRFAAKFDEYNTSKSFIAP